MRLGQRPVHDMAVVGSVEALEHCHPSAASNIKIQISMYQQH